jgi:hypothetical protein
MSKGSLHLDMAKARCLLGNVGLPAHVWPLLSFDEGKRASHRSPMHKNKLAGFEVFAPITMKIAVFWDRATFRRNV